MATLFSWCSLTTLLWLAVVACGIYATVLRSSAWLNQRTDLDEKQRKSGWPLPRDHYTEQGQQDRDASVRWHIITAVVIALLLLVVLLSKRFSGQCWQPG